MEDRSLNKALDIYSALITGQSISLKDKATAELYNEFYSDSEVYDITTKILARQGLSIYEYNESLFVTAVSGNKVFGYTNDELKRILGLRLNVELYLVFFITYHALLYFYKSSDTYQVREYVRVDEVINSVTQDLRKVLGDAAIAEDHTENSFKSIASLWEGLPPFLNEDRDRNKASRGSRYGMTKLTFNFLMNEKLFVNVDDRFYPTDRMHALAENYFEENRSLIQEYLEQEKDNA